MSRLFAVGDVHGDVERLLVLLREAGLTGDYGSWRGGDSTLVFTGDLTDRGREGLAVIGLVRDLQVEAETEGGRVECLMGNHDALILARAFEWRGEAADPDCRDLFVMNGGRDVEAKELAHHDNGAFEWMQARPLMLRVGETLFQHADSAVFYGRLGGSVEEVNAAGTRLAQTGVGAWRILYEMTDGRDWDMRGLRALRGAEAAVQAHLKRFGARRVVHGHTRHLETEPLVYLGGRAINIDGTLSEGYRRTPGRGFVADLDALRFPDALGYPSD